MLFSKLILAAASASTILAAPAHHHNQHKRDNNIIVKTVIVNEEGTVIDSGNSQADSGNKKETNINSNSNNNNNQASTGGSSGSSSGSGSGSGSGSSSGSSSGLKPTGKGITYSPYAADGQCKDAAAVKKDLELLSEFEIIRLYGVDCNQVENVMQAKAKNQKLFLGIFFMDKIEAGCKQMAEAVTKYGSWDDVHTVSVGNELVNNGAATVDQISSYVSTAKSALRAAGYNGPVVSVDTHVATIAHPGLCSISDYIAINAHAYFDYNTEASGSGEWLKLQIQRVKEACGGNKDVLVTETGWPHDGNTNGQAVATKEAQTAAINSIKEHVPENAILFNAYDDMWKQPGNLNCEQYWGLH